MNWILTVALGLLLAACDAPSRPDTLVVSSDPELRALAASLLPDLAGRAGLELRRPVRLERRSREQLVRYLTAKLDEDLSPEEEARITRSYALLGLVPADLDLRELLLSVYTEQVAGFYDPDSAALFVLDDQPAEALSTVLVHELVHAVQDQAVDLDSLTARERGNDRQTAAQAAIEGQATLVMLEHMMESLQGAAVDLSEVDGFARQLRPMLEGMRAQYPALAAAPRVIQESLLFPYLEGVGYVQRVWKERDGRPAPFGEHLPLSTKQVLQPERLLGPEREDPGELALRFSDAEVVHTDVLGRLEAGVMLEELSGGASAPDAAAGWHADRYALLETAAGHALVWVAVWEDDASRDLFVERLRPLLDRLPRPGTLETSEVSGAPASVLRVDWGGEVEATLVEFEHRGAFAAPAAGAPAP